MVERKKLYRYITFLDNLALLQSGSDSGSGAIEILDISDPLNLDPIREMNVGNHIPPVVISHDGSKLYQFDSYSVKSLDLSDNNSEWQQVIATRPRITGFDMYDNQIYLLMFNRDSNNSINLLDSQSGSTEKIIDLSSKKFQYPALLKIDNEYAFVIEKSNALIEIYDLDADTGTGPIFSHTYGGKLTDIAINGDYAYVTIENLGIRIIKFR